MIETPVALRIRRILVGLDASPDSLAALEAAVELAAAEDAELLGVFVEDLNLLRLAQLPFNRTLTRISARRVRCDSADVDRELRLRAETAAAALAALAGARHVRWSFRTVRGVMPDALVDEAATVDLVTVGRASWAYPGQRAVGTTLRAVVASGRVATLVISGHQRLAPPVVLLDDGTVSGATGLAKNLGERLGGAVHAVVIAATAAAAAEQERYLAAAAAPISLWVETVIGSDRHAVLAAIQATRPGVVVSPRYLSLLARDGLAELLETVDCPVLLTP